MTRGQDKKIIKKRDPGIDFIRVIACLLVIGIHVDVMGTGDSSKFLIRLLFSDGVTLFFILSGFFFFKKSFSDMLRHTMTGIVIPGVIVMLISYQFAPFIRDEHSLLYCFTHINFDICMFVTDLLSWGGSIRESLAGHLWYIFTYLELVLAYPLLKPLYTYSVNRGSKIVDKDEITDEERGTFSEKAAEIPDSHCGKTVVLTANRETYNTQTGSMGLFSENLDKLYAGDKYCRYRWFIIGFIFLNQIVMDLNMTGLISLFPVQISPFMLYTTPAMLLMIGAEIGYLKHSMRESSGKIGILALTIWLMTFIARFFMQKLVFSYNQSQDFYFYWNCAFATVQSTAFVIGIMCLDLNENKVVNFIAGAGRYTFYIYLLHYGIYYMFYYRYEPDWSLGLIDMTGGYNTMTKELMHILIRLSTVFGLSLALSFIIAKCTERLKDQKRTKKKKHS